MSDVLGWSRGARLSGRGIEKLPDAVADSEVVLQYTDGSLKFFAKALGIIGGKFDGGHRSLIFWPAGSWIMDNCRNC